MPRRGPARTRLFGGVPRRAGRAVAGGFLLAVAGGVGGGFPVAVSVAGAASGQEARGGDGERPLRVDIHAHPSRFHRAEAPRISDEEIARYLDRGMDAVVATISTDTPYRGGYVLRDGTRIESGNRRPEPGEPWAYTLDRFERLTRTVAEANAVFVRTPAEARRARAEGALAILPAVEGADSLEGDLERLRELHGMGLALLQLVHFRPNGLGHIQTWPYTPGGLTAFGREVVRECNRLGIVLDLAHANPETIRDTLALSTAPVVFSHTGAFALREHDRHLRDPEIRAIAEAGGVIGIWPNAGLVPTVADLARHVRWITDLGGIGSAGFGSDLRGMSAYSEGFGDEANFEAIAEALAEAGFDEDAVDAVLGGNFERVWTEATAHLADSDRSRPPFDTIGAPPAEADFDDDAVDAVPEGNLERVRTEATAPLAECDPPRPPSDIAGGPLAEARLDDDAADAVLGGNFERVWTEATARLAESDRSRPPFDTIGAPLAEADSDAAAVDAVPGGNLERVRTEATSPLAHSDRSRPPFDIVGSPLPEARLDDDAVDAVLGGNFERVWTEATARLAESDRSRPPIDTIGAPLAEADSDAAAVDAVPGGNLERVWPLATASLAHSDRSRPPFDIVGSPPAEADFDDPAVDAVPEGNLERVRTEATAPLAECDPPRPPSDIAGGPLAEARLDDDAADAAVRGNFGRVRAEATASLAESDPPRPRFDLPGGSLSGAGFDDDAVDPVVRGDFGRGRAEATAPLAESDRSPGDSKSPAS